VVTYLQSFIVEFCSAILEICIVSGVCWQDGTGWARGTA
jgi:hypothetical protein